MVHRLTICADVVSNSVATMQKKGIADESSPESAQVNLRCASVVQHVDNEKSIKKTSESSNEKTKRKREKDDEDDVHSKKRRGRERIKPSGAIQKKKKVEACLRKIQALKKSLFGSSNH
ncbi:hypothetical protein Tco_0617530 [Tanacetum coccineum]